MSKATNSTNEQTVGNGYEIQADDVKMFTTKLGSRKGWRVSVCGTTAQNVVTAWDGQWMKVLIKIDGEWVKVGSFHAKSKGRDSMGRLIFDRTGARKQAFACLKKFIGGMVIANLNLDCDWLEVAPASETETTEEPAQAETVEVEEPAQVETVLLTSCCNAYDTYWGDTHVCRKCHGEWPEMVEAEEPAQVETVEEPAQTFAPGDAVIATYKGAQTRGVIVCEYVCPDDRKGYPDERFYSSPEDPVYVVQERGEEREIAYRASHLKRCLEAHA